ncbi:hypothetical protein CHARACLAT_002321 [Characodon lateralis]|uniref:Uncharacterized protein n=1 Tax=Characodon lateralis TaxID=208331 RepID=A0ABU7ERX6_9TELE|nr:hypothetical protein [Characodon lateralis]
MSPCWQADITLQLGSRVTTITCNKPPEAALIEADFPTPWKRRPGPHRSESFSAASRPLKEPNVPLSYSSAGPAKSPFHSYRGQLQDNPFITHKWMFFLNAQDNFTSTRFT